MEEHRSIKISTYGILFMGTPHQGGGGVHLGELVLNVASIFLTTNNGILQHLERDSEWLQQQLGQYAPISREFVTKFAYEILPTPIALGNTMMVRKFLFYTGKLLMRFRLYHGLRRLYPVPQMRNRLPYQQIILIWLSLPRVRMVVTKRCQNICGYWPKRRQMLSARVGQNKRKSKRVRKKLRCNA